MTYEAQAYIFWTALMIFNAVMSALSRDRRTSAWHVGVATIAFVGLIGTTL